MKKSGNALMPLVYKDKNDKCFREPVSVLFFLTTVKHFSYIIFLQHFEFVQIFFSFNFTFAGHFTAYFYSNEIEKDYCEMALFSQKGKVT